MPAPRRPYDLDVVPQWIVVLLARYGETTYRRLEAELAAIRGTPPAEVVEGLLKLEELALIERTAATGLMVAERRFTLSAIGRKVRRYVPEEPRSPTIFYV